MRVYVAGKMTGLPDHNRPAFEAAAKRLREQGHFVINPAELSAMFGSEKEIAESFKVKYGLHFPHDASADCFVALIREASKPLPVDGEKRCLLADCVMDADLAAVRSCDAIYLLRGWETSRGAKRELAEAIAHGLMVLQEGIKEPNGGAR